MPELEASIQQWKARLTAAFGGSAEIVDELESHLRDEIDQQIGAGQSPDAALAIARAKLGAPASLAAEYARAVPASRWWPIFAAALLPISMCALVAWNFHVVAPMPGRAVLLTHVATLITGYAVAFYVALLGGCYVACWLIKPIGLGQRRSLNRALVVANTGAALLLFAGMALGSVYAKEHFGAYWNNDPREFGTLLSLAWLAAMSISSGLSPQRQHAWALLSIVGAGICSCGWLGPTLFHQIQQTGAGWPLPLAITVAAAIVLPLAIASLGLLPPASLRRRTA